MNASDQLGSAQAAAETTPRSPSESFQIPNDVSPVGAAAWTPAGATATLERFLTDGSLVRLCDELSRLTGVPVWLRELSGRVIVPTDPASGQLWEVVEGARGRARAYRLAARHDDGSPDLVAVPLRIVGVPIGELVLPGPGPADDPLRRRALERAVGLLARFAGEVIESQVYLRQRVNALDALYRLSSMLVKAEDPDTVLRTALDLACDVLHADAGSIAVFDDGAGDDAELVYRASRGLSEDWLRQKTPLSVQGRLRTAALAGEVVIVDDLLHDERIADHNRPAAEGLFSLISAGLIFQGRASGLIRLYTRRLRHFGADERELLRSIAEHAAMALMYARTRRLREDHQRIQRQVRLAASVQRRMLPRYTPRFDRFDIAGRYTPSFDLGGDFYDFFDLKGRLGVVVGDVVGNGVPAAMLMSAVRASLRAHAQDDPDVAATVARVNRDIARDTLDNEFATLWFGMADPVSLTLTYAGAGHEHPLLIRVPPPAVRRVGMEDVVMLGEGGMALGIDPEQPYEPGIVPLGPGDLLAIYTDGVTDSTSFDGRKFGVHGLRRALLELLGRDPDVSAANAIEHVFWELRQHGGVRFGADDVSLVILRVR